jgi:hypothetical protein
MKETYSRYEIIDLMREIVLEKLKWQNNLVENDDVDWKTNFLGHAISNSQINGIELIAEKLNIHMEELGVVREEYGSEYILIK